MYKSISGVPGIVGMVQIHGNGFYTPSNELLTQFIIPGSNCMVDLQNVTYPFELILIGFHSTDRQCFKEFVVTHNDNQVRYLYNSVIKYCAIIPKSCLNEAGLNLDDDHIMPRDATNTFDTVK